MVSEMKSLKENELKLIQEDVNTIKSEFNSINGPVKEISAEMLDLKNANKLLENKIDKLEQYGKKQNIIVNGLLVTENEDLRERITQLANELDVEVFDRDISAIHRLPAKEGRIPGIVVRLNNLDIKSQLIRSSRREKLEWNGSKIFVDEHLTRKNADILIRAKGLAKKGIVWSAWYNNAKI